MNIATILARSAELLGVGEESRETIDQQRLLGALDAALGELARVYPVQARCRLEIINGTAPLPPTVLTPRGLYQKGRRVPMTFSEGSLMGEDGVYTLVYYRIPMRASEEDPSARPPLPSDICLALPFYCAAVYVMADDPALYNRLMEQYNTKIASALGYRPLADVEGGSSL